MTEESSSEEFRDIDRIKENFLYPIGHYYGEFTPENLVFNSQSATVRPTSILSLQSRSKW